MIPDHGDYQIIVLPDCNNENIKDVSSHQTFSLPRDWGIEPHSFLYQKCNPLNICYLSLLQVVINVAFTTSWSVILDSNQWPFGPKPNAIPGFANHRFVTSYYRCLVPLSGIEPPSTLAPLLQSGVPTMELVERDESWRRIDKFLRLQCKPNNICPSLIIQLFLTL